MLVSSNIRVVIVGHRELAREGLRRILADSGFNVEAATRYDLSSGVAEERPHLIIIKAESVDEGIDMVTILRAALPDVRLLLMTAACDIQSMSRAFAAGIDGYMSDTIACETLIATIPLIVMGEKIVPTHMVNALLESPQPARATMTDFAKSGVNLSEREYEILERLVCGEANKMISRRLTISEATVKVHVKAILRKLHVLNRTQAAIWGVNSGMFVSPSSNA